MSEIHQSEGARLPQLMADHAMKNIIHQLRHEGVLFYSTPLMSVSGDKRHNKGVHNDYTNQSWNNSS